MTITIDEAIKILTEDTENNPFFLPDETIDAIRLGIEALKREKQRRKEQTWGGVRLLPGETEE